MNTKISEMSPRLYAIHNFKYVHKERKGTRLNTEKTQYVYRFLCFTKGRLDAYIGAEKISCYAGDILYLTPGEKYKLVPLDCDFSLYNVFFDFLPYENERREGDISSCIFALSYNPSLCSSQINFEDAPLFNKSTLFKDADCARIFESVLTADKTDPLYPFYAKAALCSAISQILQSERQKMQKVQGAEQILTYIELNPEKDLSCDTLSLLFSYHKNHINHLIKTATGATLKEYIRRVKINHAKMLLSEGELPPAQVSEKLGYYDYSHFYKAFKEETGISPTEYAKRK